jgi:hypothetical protein
MYVWKDMRFLNQDPIKIRIPYWDLRRRHREDMFFRPTMTTLSHVGWLQRDRNPGFGITGNARLRQPSRIILSSFVNIANGR